MPVQRFLSATFTTFWRRADPKPERTACCGLGVGPFCSAGQLLRETADCAYPASQNSNQSSAGVGHSCDRQLHRQHVYDTTSTYPHSSQSRQKVTALSTLPPAARDAGLDGAHHLALAINA